MIVARIGALATQPRSSGAEKLAGEQNSYRVRQGNYRIVYTIDDRNKLVVIQKIGDRKDICRRGAGAKVRELLLKVDRYDPRGDLRK